MTEKSKSGESSERLEKFGRVIPSNSNNNSSNNSSDRVTQNPKPDQKK